MDLFVDFYSRTEPEGRERHQGHLKIIVTSRPYRTIEDGFHNLPEARLIGENETNVISKDIERMVNARVVNLGSKRKLSDSVQAKLKDRLISGEKFSKRHASSAKTLAQRCRQNIPLGLPYAPNP